MARSTCINRAKPMERSMEIPKRRTKKAVKLSKRDSWLPANLNEVAFSEKPVNAVHIIISNRALPPLMCHGSSLALVSASAPGNKNVHSPKSHCPTNQCQSSYENLSKFREFKVIIKICYTCKP